MSNLAKFMIVDGADNCPPMLDKPQYESRKIRMALYIQQDGTVRLKTYEELSDKEKLQADCVLKATKIVLQGLPPDVYALVNHHKISKDMWDRVKLLMQDTSLSKQERECKLYDEFDKFSYMKGEALHQYYLRLPPEWGKFVTDVKLARDLHTFPNPLALVANYHQPPSHFNNYHSQYTNPQYPQQFSPPTQHAYSSPPYSNPYEAPCLAVPTFLPGDDPIACMNKEMTFLSAVFSPRYPSTNNQLRSSSNPRNQATIKDGRVTVQQVQGRQGQNVVGSGSHRNASGSRGNTSGETKVIKCYNCQGEGHMARQCTQPKRIRDSTWFKEKVLLVQAQAEGKELDEEQLAFLADSGVTDNQVAQTITHNAAFQTDDLDAYDSDCDDISSAKAVLMANLSRYDSDVLKLAIVQNTNTSVQQNSMILSMFEQMSNHETNSDKANNESKIINETLTTELERYKERVKILEQRFNVDLSSHENFIDSQMDDMIRMKNTKFDAFEIEIDTLKQALYKHVKEKESLLTTLKGFKTEFKERESKSIDKEIVL
ncbi:retrovirus-related pol polyprotein from transposon TNT 1-94 [Tanacetum coccineum]